MPTTREPTIRSQLLGFFAWPLGVCPDSPVRVTSTMVFHGELAKQLEQTMKVLMVLTSHDQLGNTGRKTGFWLEELAAPYFVFKESGAEITLASPKGGRPPLDPKSNEPEFRTDFTRRSRRGSA